jgi:hypothetical protein
LGTQAKAPGEGVCATIASQRFAKRLGQGIAVQEGDAKLGSRLCVRLKTVQFGVTIS